MRHGDRPITIGLDLSGDVPVRKVMTLRDVLPTQPLERSVWIPCDRCGREIFHDLIETWVNDEGVEYLRLCGDCAQLRPVMVVEIDAVPQEWAEEIEPETPVEELLVPEQTRANIDVYWEVDDERPDVETKFCAWGECDRKPLEWGQVGEFIPKHHRQRYCSVACRHDAERLRYKGLRPGEQSEWFASRKHFLEPEPESPTIHTGSSPEELHAWAIAEHERKTAKEQEHEQGR